MAGSLRGPFRTARAGWDCGLLVLFVLVNGIVLTNAIRHPPGVGYDAGAHVRYIRVLSRLRLPTPEQTYEFFTPPLSYLPPAALLAGGMRETAVGKAAQLLNVVYSLGATFLLLRVCERIRPGAGGFKRDALLLLGLLPVYYKTFAFVRPEPLLALLWMLAADGTLRVFPQQQTAVRSTVALGAVLGLLVLARQQGFFWIFALLLFVGAGVLARPELWRRWLWAAAVSLGTAFLVGGWFYLHLYAAYGSPMAYAKEQHSFSLANQPREFYVGTGDGKLFEDPVRPAFRNQLVPTLHSETWGDYGCYFLVSGLDKRNGTVLFGGALEDALSRKRARFWLQTNRVEMGRYLGRVNLVSIVPSLVLVAGLIAACWRLGRFVLGAADEHAARLSPVALGVLVSLAGYLFLLIRDASHSGNMIKATYILQVFPLLAVLGADLLAQIGERRRTLYRATLAALALVGIHNVFACFSTY